MSNILNSQISPNDNPIAARRISRNDISRLVQAPQSLPTYSIDAVLKEKDEFRRSVVLSHNKEIKKKEYSFLPKVCLALAALTVFFIFKCKK